MSESGREGINMVVESAAKSEVSEKRWEAFGDGLVEVIAKSKWSNCPLFFKVYNLIEIRAESNMRESVRESGNSVVEVAAKCKMSDAWWKWVNGLVEVVAESEVGDWLWEYISWLVEISSESKKLDGLWKTTHVFVEFLSKC